MTIHGSKIIYLLEDIGADTDLSINVYDSVAVAESVAGGLPDSLKPSVSDSITVEELVNVAGVSEVYPYYSGSRIADEDRVDLSGADDVDVDISTLDKFILCIMTKNVHPSGLPTVSAEMKLQWKNETDAGPWTDLTDSGEMIYTSDTVLTDGDYVQDGEYICSLGSTYQDSVNKESEDGQEFHGALNYDKSAESQFAISAANAHPGDTYAFRMKALAYDMVLRALARGKVKKIKMQIDDTVTVTENVSVELPDALAISEFDPVTVAESVTAELPDALEVDVSDPITVTDTPTVSTGVVHLNINVFENVGVSDVVAAVDVAWVFIFVGSGSGDTQTLFDRNTRSDLANIYTLAGDFG